MSTQRTLTMYLSRLLAAAPILALALAGCTDPPASTPADPVAQEITRDAAVREARNDAAIRFQLVAPSSVVANRVGHYWLVDLVGPEGSRLHYAIATDGMIRERRVDR
jgi:hypothetical protein